MQKGNRLRGNTIPRVYRGGTCDANDGRNRRDAASHHADARVSAGSTGFTQHASPARLHASLYARLDDTRAARLLPATVPLRVRLSYDGVPRSNSVQQAESNFHLDGQCQTRERSQGVLRRRFFRRGVDGPGRRGYSAALPKDEGDDRRERATADALRGSHPRSRRECQGDGRPRAQRRQRSSRSRRRCRTVL